MNQQLNAERIAKLILAESSKVTTSNKELKRAIQKLNQQISQPTYTRRVGWR